MTIAKLSLAALLVGASLAPAFAEDGDLAASPLTVFQQSIGIKAAPAAAPVIEGRQAAPVAAPASSVDRYLIDRNGPSQR